MNRNKFNLLLFFLIFIFLSLLLFNYSYLNSILWAIATILIIASGFYFSYKIKFTHLNIKEIINCFKVQKKKKDEVSVFESLSISLAGRIGVGSLSGVALAIYVGGAGTIFWMWIITFIASANTFVESVLGVIYQKKDYGNVFVGGPSFYIKNGLRKEKLAIFYALLILISYILGFLTIQSNTIVKSVNTLASISPIVITLIIALVSSLVIFNGVKQIANFTSYIIPLMGIIYLVVGGYIIITNFTDSINSLKLIVSSAFNLKSFFSGFIPTLIIGVQRGIFSNESGLGTSAIASATTKDSPIKQGYVQVLGIYITTLVVCTLTALIILTSNYQTLSLTNINGIEITSYAFNYHLGNFGNIILTIIVILFAFSTIISGYYYGEASLKFLKKNISSKNLSIFKLLSIIIISLGGVISSSIIWNFVDIFVAILVIVNIYAIFNLRGDLFYELKEKQRKRKVSKYKK